MSRASGTSARSGPGHGAAVESEARRQTGTHGAEFDHDQGHAEVLFAALNRDEPDYAD